MSEPERQLFAIARSLARPEFVQGGGGNMSVKIDKNWMLIKSSGIRFKEIKSREGLTRVNYKKLSEGLMKSKDNFLLACTHEKDRVRGIRPSMEAWFHVFLDSYVIHTHSVYANIAACSEEGEAVAQQIFKKLGLRGAWIPYSTPGIELAKKMKIALKHYEELPEVLLLENHGLIISTRDYPRCLKLHKQVNEAFKKFFSIRTSYPGNLNQIKTFLRAPSRHFEGFNKTVLFPDQCVYARFSAEYIDLPERAAETFREILAVYFYLRENIHRLGYHLHSLPIPKINQLKRMEAEKYRQELLLRRP